jgi:signal transduction histidine kinase
MRPLRDLRSLLGEETPAQRTRLAYQAIAMRGAVALVLFTCALGAYLAGIIGWVNFQGTAVSSLAIVVLAWPSYLVTRSSIGSRRGLVVSALDRALLILCFTGFIYSLGGVEAGYLIALYAVFTMYVGVASHWRLPFTVAGMSVGAFAVVVVLEHEGVIPHVNVVAGFTMPWRNQVALLGAAAALIFTSAAASSRAARTIEAGRALLKQQNEELARARDKARESDRLKSEFLASMSHELRTPLNHVIGFTEVVLQDTESLLSAQGREYLGDALQSGRHLQALLNDLLDTASIDAGRVELDRRATALPALLTRSLTVVKDSAERAGIRLQARLGELPATAWIDARRINQVLYNLLSNAVKFTPAGGSITLLARMAGGDGDHEAGRLEVRVTDTGIGLHEGDRARVFGPFERGRTGSAAGVPGTGLGLYVARRIVELHGGQIWAESEGEGRGTTVGFRVPITAPATAKAMPPGSVRAEAP